MVTKEERRKMAWDLLLAATTSDSDINFRAMASFAWAIVDDFLEAETDGEAEDLETPGVEGDRIEDVKARIAAVQARDGGVSEAAVRVGYNRTVER